MMNNDIAFGTRMAGSVRRLTGANRAGVLFCLAALAVANGVLAQTPVTAVRPVTLNGTLPGNDDGSTGTVPLNIGGASGLNFFGQNFTNVYVNNNGNLTFRNSSGTFTPNGLATGVGQPIIAPFFADVDTRGFGSGLTMYGNATVNGFNAFVASWINVGYYGSHTNKLNSFQTVLIDRSDTGAGNFDIELNYDKIQWETGDASGGSNGLGGTSAVAGYSNGSDTNNIFFQLPGSLVNGALLDGGPNSLIANSLNSTVPGRYVFQVRNGAVMGGGGGGAVAPTISTTFLPTGAVGQPYVFNMAATGGSGNYSWTAKNLPPGLSISSGGLVSGIPSVAGSFANVTVQVTDTTTSLGAAATFIVGIRSSTVLISGNGFLPNIALGQTISGSFSASGGAPPYFWSVQGLPAGIAFSGGSYSGTPTAAGNYSFIVQVVDSQGSAALGAVSYSVFGISGSALPKAVAYTPYSTNLAPIGGSSPYAFSATGVPPGLALTGDGTLKGMATAAGNYSIGVTVTDAGGLRASATFSIAVVAPPALKVVPSSLSPATVSSQTSQNLSATGGAPPYAWSFAAGTLPDGLSIRTNGTVSGTPTRIGSYTFSARARDFSGASAVGTYTIAVAALPLVVTSPTPLSQGMVSVDYPVQTLGATGGIPPYSFAVTGGSLPAGLSLSPAGAVSGTPIAAGTANFGVTATDSAGTTGSATLFMTIRAFSPDIFLSAGSLSFNMSAGSLPPGSQAVTVQATDVTQPANWSAAVTPSVPWLTLAGTTGRTPASFFVQINSAASALTTAGSPYTAAVTVTCNSGPCSGKSQVLGVTLNIANNPPQLSVLTDSLSYTTSSTAPAASSQSFGIQNSGGGSLGIGSISCAAAWCKVASIPGSIQGGGSAQVTVTADPSSLGAGYYWTSLTVLSSGGTVIFPVTYYIAANGNMTLAPSGTIFDLPQGGAASGIMSFSALVSSRSPVNFTASVQPGAPWLRLPVSSGTTSGTQAATVSYTLDPASVAALTAGTYYGTIRIASAGIANSPLDYQVILNVSPAASRTRPNLAPGGLIFLTQATSAPPSQTVTLYTGSANPVPFQSSVMTNDGGSWLAASPASGTTTSASPAQVTISVTPAGLRPGFYSGMVNLAFSAAAVRSVNVTLIVQPAVAATVTSNGLHRSDVTAGCTPTLMMPAQTGLVSNFAAPTSWPTPLAIRLLTDCGSAVANGQVVATFSNGDPPVTMSLADGDSGFYAGTWTPRHSTAQVTVTARASAPGFPTATTQISGAVTPNAAPFVAHNGTANFFNPVGGAPLAPGTLIRITGQYLAAKTTATSALPVPLTLGGTSVIIGGIPAPVMLTSPTEVDAQVPFELPPDQPYQIVVNANGALSTPDGLQAGSVSPGLSVTPGGFVNASHADGTLITEDLPAKPRENITIYLAGMGPTDTPVQSGTPSPVSPVANTANPPVLTLDGKPVTFVFAGLTPGLVGVYQVNMQVPADAADGDLTLAVSQTGVGANAGLLPVHQ